MQFHQRSPEIAVNNSGWSGLPYRANGAS